MRQAMRFVRAMHEGNKSQHGNNAVADFSIKRGRPVEKVNTQHRQGVKHKGKAARHAGKVRVLHVPFGIEENDQSG